MWPSQQINKHFTFILLLLILCLAGLLRFYTLGAVPDGLHRDEAFLGYNAYSLLKTGKDISGNFLPIHLKSFLYSPAGYSYFSIPWISFFGLNAFSTRFSSAFFGTLTTLLVFRLAMNLFRQHPLKKHIAMLSSLLLAISPWHINLSRTATENILVVFFLTLGVLWYQQWHQRNSVYYLIASFTSFALTLIIYQAPRAFLPLLIPFLILLFRSKDKKAPSNSMSIILFFVAILLPIFAIIRSPELSLRLKTVSIFATQENQLVIDEQAREDGVTGRTIFTTRFYHNKIRSYVGQVAKNYFSHLTYDFLFTDKGLPDRYRVPGAGLMYPIELPFLLIGIYTIIKKRQPEQIILLPWLFLGFVGSALTFDDVPNLQRTLLIFPTIPMLTALGFIHVYSSVQSKRAYAVTIVTVCIFSLSYYASSYVHAYYSHLLVHKPWYRQEGYRDLVVGVNQLLPNYKKAVITNRESAPAIFFLFYGSYDPATFQRETHGISIKDYDRVNFSKYEFSVEGCPFKTTELASGEKAIYPGILPDTLYVNSGNCAPIERFEHVLQTVFRADGTPIFILIELTQKTAI